MKKILSLAILLMAVVGFTACSNESKQQEKYTEFKSAIITYDVFFDTIPSSQVTYIDNYGKDWFEYQDLPGHGLQLATANDSVEYIIFLEDSTGIKHPSDNGAINWLNLNDSIISRYNIQKAGQEEVLGRMCDKYTMEWEGPLSQKAHCTDWIWKGATMKRVYEDVNGTMTQVATDIQIDVEIPAEKITLPEGIDYENWMKKDKVQNTDTLNIEQ